MISELDLRGTRCPMNLLKVKLALEALRPGEALRVLLDPGEGMENVPRALGRAGHQVLRADEGEPCTLLVRKASQDQGET